MKWKWPRASGKRDLDQAHRHRRNVRAGRALDQPPQAEVAKGAQEQDRACANSDRRSQKDVEYDQDHLDQHARALSARRARASTIHGWVNGVAVLALVDW